ncbi:uncharacterized protein MONBRDRAFT_6613 [Monosiga brevicollis MX1]|uniref:Pectate lyase superfamily protein domain-containing protein n=1 Tax=Monosiga brevicollis TaxID=81824 RepID=A9UUS7_MONBE|nr:uncharacterized protein MONBRDRAFT_6613 [Monosiga brevicollis MX1]EDQ90772.1 predicted protein [Monosiga brevicollis MX1]|eukprot:XP_001744069.1 hypothetical protein [Monosiga brevicollis MX1]
MTVVVVALVTIGTVDVAKAVDMGIEGFGRAIPQPRDLEHAKELHAQALRHASDQRRRLGTNSAASALPMPVVGLLPGDESRHQLHRQAGRQLFNEARARGRTFGEPVVPTINPITYGADPTGRDDSTAAFQAAMKDLLSYNASVPKMASGITNLGGITMDLQGGEYLISQSLVFPTFFGNARIVRGSLRASRSFPSDGYLIQIGQDGRSCQPDQQKSCNEFIELSELLLDASQTGVVVNGGANILIGVHTWNGGGIGIQVNSHNTRLSTCYLDYNHLLINDPSKVIVEDTFFLQAVHGQAEDTILRYNSFTNDNPVAVAINGTFTSVCLLLGPVCVSSSTHHRGGSTVPMHDQ